MAKGTINIYDYIGKGGIESKDVLNILDGFKSNEVSAIEVRINSPGGSIFEGFSIFNQLRDFKDVTTVIDGVAASIASIIALSGSSIKAYKNSYLFVHNPWSLAIGDTNDMQKVADDLNKFRETIIELYKSKTGKSEDELKEFCNNSTFLTSDEALELGFIDEIIDNYPNTKSFVALYSDINGELSLNDPDIQSPNPVAEHAQSTVEAEAIDFSEIRSLIDSVKAVLTDLKGYYECSDIEIEAEDQNSIPEITSKPEPDITQLENYLNSQVNKGNLLPSLKESFLNILDHYGNADNENLTSSAQSFFQLIPSPQDLLQENFASKPEAEVRTDSDEYDLEAVDEDSLALHRKAKNLMNENKISYKEAIVSLSKTITN